MLFVFLLPLMLVNKDYHYRATQMHSADYAVARCPSVRLSVYPSVCHTPVLCLNGYTILTVFSPSGNPTISVFPYQTGWQYYDGDPSRGRRMQGGMKKSRFSTNIGVYLGTDATYSHYYRRRTGNRTQAFKWHQFE